VVGLISKPIADLFAGLTADEISIIVSSGTKRMFETGRIICRTGETATHLFLLDTGAVNFYRLTEEGQEILLRRLSPGESFGLGTLLAEPTTYIGTAESVGKCEIHIWGREWVRRFVALHPRFADNALRIALEYIRLYSERHMALVSKGAEDRLAQTLARLGSRIGTPGPHGLEIPISNKHLASLSDLGPFTVSRLLKRLERKGAVEKKRGQVFIRCPEKMLA
jgi:CRP/FNR family transcriptional regulator, nitrogen oxide reductase regulator